MGDRIGRGKGFYDRYLSWYMKQCTKYELRKPEIVALAFQEQIVDQIPMTDHDIRISKIFIE